LTISSGGAKFQYTVMALRRIKMLVFFLFLFFLPPGTPLDSVAAKYIENLGLALVIVNPKRISKNGDNSKKVEENFLSKVPEGVAITAATADRRNKKDAKRYKYYRKLGLYIGYMDAEGVKKTEQAGAKVHGTEYFSLIRPIAKTCKVERRFNLGIEGTCRR
jgi:hypothetical protein